MPASRQSATAPAIFDRLRPFPARLSRPASGLAALGLPGRSALAQNYDCGGLQAKIADIDRRAAHAGRGSGASAPADGAARPDDRRRAILELRSARERLLRALPRPQRPDPADAGDRRRAAGGGQRRRPRRGARRSRRAVQRLLQGPATGAGPPPARLLRAAFRHSGTFRNGAVPSRARPAKRRRRATASRRRMAGRRRYACAPAMAAISP